MCRNSKAARTQKVIDAAKKTTLGIGTVETFHGGMTAGFHPVGTTTAECVVCIRGSNRKLTLENIPTAIQRQYGVGPTEVVTFKEGTAHNIEDAVVLQSGAEIVLENLAGAGITAFVGVKATTGEAVKRIIADATDGAKQATDDGSTSDAGRQLEDA